MKTGIELIAEERKRQIEVEGWTLQHDSQYENNELEWAALSYAMPVEEVGSGEYNEEGEPVIIKRIHFWPFAPAWWKPTPDDRKKELAKAGALIVSALDKLIAEETQNDQP